VPVETNQPYTNTKPELRIFEYLSFHQLSTPEIINKYKPDSWFTLLRPGLRKVLTIVNRVVHVVMRLSLKLKLLFFLTKILAQVSGDIFPG